MGTALPLQCDADISRTRSDPSITVITEDKTDKSTLGLGVHFEGGVPKGLPGGQGHGWSGSVMIHEVYMYGQAHPVIICYLYDPWIKPTCSATSHCRLRTFELLEEWNYQIGYDTVVFHVDGGPDEFCGRESQANLAHLVGSGALPNHIKFCRQWPGHGHNSNDRVGGMIDNVVTKTSERDGMTLLAPADQVIALNAALGRSGPDKRFHWERVHKVDDYNYNEYIVEAGGFKKNKAWQPDNINRPTMRIDFIKAANGNVGRQL